MNRSKAEILQNLCYTELVYGRINKKLNAEFSKEQIEKMLSEIILRSIKENQEAQMKFEKFKYLHSVLFSFYDPLSEAVSIVQTNIAEIQTVFNQE